MEAAPPVTKLSRSSTPSRSPSKRASPSKVASAPAASSAATTSTTSGVSSSSSTSSSSSSSSSSLSSASSAPSAAAAAAAAAAPVAPLTLTKKRSSRKQMADGEDKDKATHISVIPGSMSHDAYLQLRRQLREERHAMLLWTSPLKTIYHFSLEALHLLMQLIEWLMERKIATALSIAAVVTVLWLLETDGAHGDLARQAHDIVYVAYYWIFLGILSSVGLGSGLHTFLFYLGPYITYVCLKAYKCNSLDFPFPDLVGLSMGLFPTSAQVPAWMKWHQETQCPPGVEDRPEVSFWKLLSAVRLPAMLWGLGTAIGELPPYFVARAARLSDEVPDDEDFEEFHESLRDESTQLISRVKRFIHHLVNKIGFLGIMLCASIPNPLFDLAGITCGHFLIPFWTFFGATMIGKAVIKTHIQTFFMLVIMSESTMQSIAKTLQNLPLVGERIYNFIMEREAQMKTQYTSADTAEPEAGLMSRAMGLLVLAMILYFGVNIVNHLAHRHRQRQDNARLEREFKRQ